jgi:hypothetical protein
MSGAVDTSDANAAALPERVVAAETLSFMYSALLAVKSRLQVRPLPPHPSSHVSAQLLNAL